MAAGPRSASCSRSGTAALRRGRVLARGARPARPSSGPSTRGTRAPRSVLSSLRRLSTQLSAAPGRHHADDPRRSAPSRSPRSGPCSHGRWQSTRAVGGRATPVAARARAASSPRSSRWSFGELMPQFLGISAPLATAKVVGPAGAGLRASSQAAHRPAQRLGQPRSCAPSASSRRRSCPARAPRRSSPRWCARSAEAGTLDAATARLVTAVARLRRADRRRRDDAARAGDRRSSAPRPPRTSCGWPGAPATPASRSSATTGTTSTASSTSSGPSRCRTTGATTCRCRRSWSGRCSCPRRSGSTRCCSSCARAGCSWPSSSTSTAAPSGVVTLEDVVEEIVGEVTDEHDRSQQTGASCATARGRCPACGGPTRCATRLGAAVPDGPAYETIGGFVMASLGRVPAVGDTVRLAGWTVTGRRHGRPRVDRLRFVPRARSRADPRLATDGGRRRLGGPAERRQRRAASGRERRRLDHSLLLLLQRVLRRRRVRRDGGAALASSSRWPTPAASAPRSCLEALRADRLAARLRPARHHRLLGAARRPRRGGAAPRARAGLRSASGLSDGVADGVALALALLIVVYLHVVVGEMIPKNLAIAGPDRRRPRPRAAAALVIARALRPVIRAMDSAREVAGAAVRGRAQGRGRLGVHGRGGRAHPRRVAPRGADRGGAARPGRRGARVQRQGRRRRRPSPLDDLVTAAR